MNLDIDLKEIKEVDIEQKIKNNNYRKIIFHTDCQISKLSALILPVTYILRQFPLLNAEIVPKYLPQPKYNVVALGGTFDHLHIGHQLLLLSALQLTKNEIIVGITGDKLLQKKKNRELIQPIQQRMHYVREYIKKIKPEIIITLPQLQEPFGPTIVRQDIDAIVVSQQTIKGGQKINEIRAGKQFKSLSVHVCQMISQNSEHDVQGKLSSSEIRNNFLHKNNFSIQELTKYREHWEGLQRKISQFINVKEESKTSKWWNIVLKQYSQYWRHYHINRHIYDMLQQYQSNWANKFKLKQEQQLILLISIWFHDVEYIPKDHDNEQKSAITAQNYLNSYYQFVQEGQQKQKLNNLIISVKNAIISTKHHKTDIFIQKLLIDIDMGILNSNNQRYVQYAEEIRRQYWPIAGQLFPVKRLEFLKSMDPKKIFYFVETPENLQTNIQWQIEALSKQLQQKDKKAEL